jgi:septin 3/9/12
MAVMEENGVRVRLNLIDTPGFGDQINNETWYGYSRVLMV